MDLEQYTKKEVDIVDIERGANPVFGDGYMKTFAKSINMDKFMRGIGGYRRLDNGKCNLVDHAHVLMVSNITVDIDKYGTVCSVCNGSGKSLDEICTSCNGSGKIPDMDESPNLKPPSLDMNRFSDAELFAVDGDSLIFTHDGGKTGTAVNLNYFSDVINTFGVPTRILCTDDYPIIIEYDDMTVLLAPRINTGEDYGDVFVFDFEKWCPQVYGKKMTNITNTQISELIYSLPLDSTIRELIDRMGYLRVQKDKQKSVMEVF